MNLTNVQGQIDVLINLEAGERTLLRLDLVVTNNGRDTIVASQTFLPSSATTDRDAGNVPPATAAVIVQSFRTDAFNPVTGAVAFRNAPTTIRAVAVEVGSTGTIQQSASSTVSANLNNLDGFVVAVRPLATTIRPTALDASGRRWYQAGRGLEVTSAPVLFSGRALGTRIIAFPGSAPVATISRAGTGVAIDTLRLPSLFNSVNSGPQYVTGSLPSVLASDAEGNALPTVPALSSGDGGGILNAQPTFLSATRLEGIRVDNAPPPAPTLTISNSQGNSNNWVNAAYRFESGLSNLVQDAGIGFAGAAGTPTVASAAVQFLVGTPSSPDTVFASAADQLLESSTNSEYSVIAELADRLGNVRRVPLTATVAHPGPRFGVDKLPPTIRYTTGSLPGKALVSANSDSNFVSNADTVGIVAVPRVFAIDVIDDRSGLPDGLVGVKLTRFAAPSRPGTFLGTTTCIIGTGAACTPVLRTFETTLPDDFRQLTVSLDGGTGLEGYYAFSATAQDQAGNVSAPISKRALIDAGKGASAPVITGLGVSGLLIGGDSARFLALATDNVEIARGGILLQYPNLPRTPAEILAGTGTQMLAYGTPLYAGRNIGTRFDSLLTTPITGTHPAFTVPNFIRSLEVVNALDEPQAYPGDIAKPNAANAWVADFAVGGAPATLATNVPIVAGSVQSPGGTPGFLAATGTPLELKYWRRAPGLPGLQVEAVGPTGQTVSPFTRVLLVNLQPSGLTVNPTVWHMISELTTPLLTDNGLRRTWRYNFGGLGSGEYLAIGVTATGDAIATARIVVP
ncbi:MAG: hypothetical protein P3B76_00380 [Gemmatimonadota bacterium]|nr:hypothetical protein [Gemmatimonadota bacterium]MDQ8167322.1 hypothetical protein [Gemmatimonadota bacterium]MDQ8171114.1 hypothetical protein [Gemmatimonadota bacterium]